MPAPPPETGRRWRGTLLLLGKALITTLILGYLLHRIDIGAVAGSVMRASWPLLGLGLGLFLLSVALGGLRWWMVLRGLGEHGPPGPLVALFWIGTAFSQVLPSTAGDGVRVWMATKRGYRLAPALTSVVLERLTMLLVLLAFVVATEPLLMRRLVRTGGFFGGQWLPVALLACGIAGLAVLLTADRLAARWRHWRAIDLLARFAVSSRTLLRSRWSGPLAALTVAAQFNLVLAGGWVADAVGLHLSLLDDLIVIPLMTLATVAPISVGGWGLREGLLVVLLGRFGIAGSDALAYSLLLGCCNALSAAPGLVLWLARR
jgi:uncharacterized membrane protein YbhN (UPF0104 family)